MSPLSLPVVLRIPKVAALFTMVWLAATGGSAATIPGLYNTGVNDSGVTLANGAVDPHYRLVQSADGSATGPSAFVVTDTLFPIVSGPWLASSAASKWIGPMANQSTGNLPGDYKYRLTFSLTGLEPATAVITGRWSSDNAGAAILLNGVATGITYDGNFGAFSAPFTISSGFIDGTNALDFVVNNAGAGANPTAFRAEISGAAQVTVPPGTPPSIITHPASRTTGIGDSASFTVSALGSQPLTYQWFLNGSPVSGATNSILTITGASSDNAGTYFVTVTNAFGGAVSSNSTLSVLLRLGPSSRRTGLVFTEIMYHPTNRADGRVLEFIELHNSNPFPEDISGWRLSGVVDYTFPANTILAGDGYLVVAPVPADIQAAYGLAGVLGGFTNRLDNEGASLRLRKKSGGVVLEVNYSDQPPWPVAADGTGHSLVLRDPTWGENNPKAWVASARKGGSPGGSDLAPNGPLERVVINEILAHTDLPLLDYLELHNHSTNTVDLSGCWLSDSPATNKFRFTNGTALPPGGYVAVNETQLGFRFAANGETLYFVSADNMRVIDAVRFDGQANGVGYGRWPDGAAEFQLLSSRTPGTTNAPPLVSDVVINEIMYHPISGSSDDEFVELHNRGTSAANIGGWRFTAGIDFTFPPGWTIPAGGYCAVAKNTARLMTNYTGLNAANLIGNFSGRLADGGDRVALGRPDFILTTNGPFVATNRFFIAVDEVRYADGGRWGRWSDGGGSSLELIDAHADNRLAPNWADSDNSSPTNWTWVETTGVTDLPHSGVLNADQLQVMLQGVGEALVDNLEVLIAGANRVTNPGFEGGATGWFFQGSHSKSFIETSAGFESTRSLHLVASVRGDHVVNRARTVLSATIPAGTVVTIRAKVRWLRGHPEVLFRLRGGAHEAVGRLNVPRNLGTPGARNSRAVTNAGPAITEVLHAPLLPQAGEAIRVIARLRDPDGVTNATVRYRVDPSAMLSSAPLNDSGTNGDAWAGDGFFTGVIPAQSAGALVAFRIEATDRFSPPATTLFPSDAPARECLVRVGDPLPTGAFGTYRFWLRGADVTTWANREKMSNEDIDTTFVYGTNRVIYNAGAHYSGSSYTSPGYDSPVGGLCGYDLNFPEDDALLGDTHFTLDWPIRDDTDQREQLMFWTLEQMGLPNMHRRYVTLYVNGLKRGTIYDDVQQPDGAALEEFFPDDTAGDLLKTDCWNEFDDAGGRVDPCILNSLEVFTSSGVKKVGRYRWNWRPRAFDGSANDFTNLFNLVDAMNAPTGTYQAAVECFVDVENWMRTFCMNDLAAFWDAFGNPNAKNTYLYKPQHDGWKLFSWDFDVGFGVFNDPTDAALFPALGDPAMNRFYAQPAWLRHYWCAMQEALNTFFVTGAGTKIDALLDGKYAAFQANGIPLVAPSAIKTWINARRSFLQTQLNTVSASFTVTTAATTNRNFITLSGTAPVTVHTITINGVAYTPVWSSVTAWRIVLPVAPGATSLSVVGLDRLGNPVGGASNSVAVTFTGAADSPQGNVVINEIMYNPVTPEAGYVELFNRSTNTAFDLSGWRMEGLDFTFPPGTVISNRGFLVICKDRAVFGSAYGWSVPVLCEYDGQLDDGGETLSLIKPGATPAQDLLVDLVTYDDDPPWPAGADGQGAALQLIDADQDNNRPGNWGDGVGWRFYSYTGNVGSSGLTRLSFYFESSGGDVYLDDMSLVIGNTPGVGVNVLSNGGFESLLSPPWQRGVLGTNTVITNAVAYSGTASLHLVVAPGSASVTTFYQDFPALTASTNYTLSYWFLSGSSGSNLNMRMNPSFRPLLDPRATRLTPAAPNSIASTLPPFPPLWLSEVQPLNTSTLADNLGDFDPWIELHNAGTTNLLLDGFTLANSFSNLSQWAFPPGTVIAPGEFLLVWADAEPEETLGTNLHASFRLNPTNGSVALARNGLLLDYLNYRRVGTNRSFGAWPPDQASFRQEFDFATPRATNDPSSAPVTLFINEWMAANAGIVTDPADYAADDWFEICNPMTNAVDLAGFFLSDEPANPLKFTVPEGTVVPAQGFLLVWADEETGQTQPGGDLHVNFKLSQAGESIALRDPSGRLIDSVSFTNQTNNISQGRWPDGAAALYFMTVPTPRGPNFIPPVTPPVIHILDVAVLPPNDVQLTWDSEPGRIYRIQFKNDLNDSGWIDLPGDVTAAGPTASKIDGTLGANEQRFYRILFVQ